MTRSVTAVLRRDERIAARKSEAASQRLCVGWQSRQKWENGILHLAGEPSLRVCPQADERQYRDEQLASNTGVEIRSQVDSRFIGIRSVSRNHVEEILQASTLRP